MDRSALCNLNVGEYATVLSVGESETSRRFLDLGMIPGTCIRCVGVSPGGDMKAYLIRGAVIAIRNTDCSGVSVTKGGEMIWD